ncbi:hypothetical protein [Pseudonocardia oroxyli]|uniref:Uncharacterized protein n=1 Tax=Pseudonocardia oroxyli TaxID=366584 RepID=A0A1G7SWY5_PSEOR|nr:hypothetical protein [Pseudonocardia oroxyli]SDG27596.1 hypothetical protein SAMN05216377_110127 [Pseudonocardia oroxyli]
MSVKMPGLSRVDVFSSARELAESSATSWLMTAMPDALEDPVVVQLSYR